MIDKRMMYAQGQRVRFRGGGRDMGSTGSSTGSAGPAGGASSGGNYGGNTGGTGNDNSNDNGNDNDYTGSDYGFVVSQPTKTPPGPTNIHDDDPNAPPAYEIIGGKKFDVTPDTKGKRQKAKELAKIMKAPIPNITDKGTSFFKDGNLLTNSFMPGDNPLSKPKFSVGNFLLNAGMFAISPALFGKYRKAKSLYSGAKFVTDTLSNITGKNFNKPFETVENLTKNIGLKDKNVIQSFKNSFTNNLTSKNKTKTTPVINTNTDNDSNDGIASLEKMDLLQDEYTKLLQKTSLNDEEQVRFNMLKNMLGI